MSRVIRRERCPECAKVGRDRHGDNLAVYEGETKYCFSCGYSEAQTGLKRPTAASNDLGNTPYSLPYDVDTTIPSEALTWLKQYHITFSDIMKNRMLWSPSREMLIFPYDEAWQGRYFGKDISKPKWFSQGNLENVLHGFNTDKKKEVILVEDIVSAIRVGNCGYSVICLFGSHLSNQKLVRLLWNWENLVFWLDYDKREYATREAIRIMNFTQVSPGVIITGKDPKEYSDEEIKNIINEYQYN